MEILQIKELIGLEALTPMLRLNIFLDMRVTYLKYLVKIYTVKVSQKQLENLSTANTTLDLVTLLRTLSKLKTPENTIKITSAHLNKKSIQQK